MGAICCCLCDESEDYVNPNNSIHRICTRLRFFPRNILYTHTPILQRGEEHARLANPLSIQGMTSFGSSISVNNSLPNSYRSPSRPLPYDSDPRYFRLQDEVEPLRDDSDADTIPMLALKNQKVTSFKNETKDSHMKSSFKFSTLKETTGFAHIYPSSEEEECPTCLEEYTPENPKITTKCSHHFHLGCIYEWMERSETCPVCGKKPLNKRRNCMSIRHSGKSFTH